jgi:dTDP-glucose pyrophosphorylase
LEEIAWNAGWLDSEQLQSQAILLKKTSYGQYLFNLLAVTS